MKRTTYIIFFTLLAFSVVQPVFAAPSDLRITPAVIDVRGERRDSFDEHITIENLSDRRVSLYPVVQNISINNGRQEFLDPSTADLTTSLANWIWVSRAEVQIDPHESKTVDFPIKIELSAKPGTYHALIAFPDGPNRPAAEAVVDSAPSILVNAEIVEVVKTGLDLTSFAPEKRFFPASPATFSFELQNNGNRTETPSGNLFIYDRNGKEVAALSVNKEGETIAPSGKKEFRNFWQGSGFGQYKALLSVSYGPDGQAHVQDTVYFWVLPWQKLILYAGTAALLFAALIYWTNRRYDRWQLERVGVSHNPGRANVSGNLSARGIPHMVDLRHPAVPDEPPPPPKRAEPPPS